MKSLNLKTILSLSLVLSTLSNASASDGAMLLEKVKAAAGDAKVSVENFVSNPSEREKALRDPSVEHVRLAQHFEKPKDAGENIISNGMVEGLLLKSVGGAIGTSVVVHFTKPKEGSKFIARLVKKGLNVVARGARIYLVTDGVASFVITLNELDPSPTAVPGAVGYLGRQAEETVKEIPARATAAAHSVSEWAKALPPKISKQFKGEVQE
jgi:hypothetical protein